MAMLLNGTVSLFTCAIPFFGLEFSLEQNIFAGISRDSPEIPAKKMQEFDAKTT